MFVSRTAFKGPYRYCAILLLHGCGMSVPDLLILFKFTQYTVPTPTFLQGSVHEAFLMCLPHLNDKGYLLHAHELGIPERQEVLSEQL